MTDNFSTSIRDLQNMPELQESIQYENKGRLDMDTEIHQAINMANKINKKLDDYKETMTQVPQYNEYIPKPEIQEEESSFTKVLNLLKNFNDKNDLFVIIVLIVLVFSQQFTEVFSKYIPMLLENTNFTVIVVKAVLIALLYHIIKKLLL